MSTLWKALMVSVLLGGTAVLTGCEEEGPAEEAGAALDDAMDEAGDTLEQAGDEAEQALDN